MQGLTMSLLKQICLVGWFLDSPSHLSTQTSSSYQLCDLLLYSGKSPMWCSVETDPLWDGSDLSSLWCLTLPLVSLALCPLSAFASLSSFSVFCPSLRVLVSFSVSLGLSVPLNLSTDCLLSLFMALKPYVPRLFGSSSAFVDSPSAVVLGVPCSVSSLVLREWPHVLL